jgi:hypothetical protein
LRLLTRLTHRDFLSRFVPSLLLVLCTAVASSTAAFARSDEWLQIDHKGTITRAGGDNIPAWTGWTEKGKKSGDGDGRYRTKINSDGTELRFNYNSVWGPPCHDRFIVDLSGKIVVPPKYTQVEHYYNGFAAVQKSHGSQWLLLDKSGSLRYTLPRDMKPQIHARFWGVASNGFLAVEKGGPDFDSPDLVDGLYDLKNKKFYPVGRHVIFNEFSEGLSCFSPADSTKDGYVDTKGKIVIPARFDEAGNFKEGAALVRLGAQRGFINHTGKLVTKLPSICVEARQLSEGLAPVAIKNSKGQPKWGFVDKSGKVVIPPMYWVDERWFYCNPPWFSEGLAPVAIGDEVHHKYGFIDKTGKWKIAAQFKNADGFVDGAARVQTGDSGFSKAEWIERQGRYVFRSDIFDLYVKQFGLLGESKSEVFSSFGEPDKSLSDGAIYNLVTSFCGNAYLGVEIHFDGDKVTKYRRLSLFNESKWIESKDKQSSHSNLCKPLEHARKVDR